MKQFGRREVLDAITVRGHMEGLAVRLIAEHGVPRMLATAFKDCLDVGDRILATRLDDDGYARYTTMNDRFHSLIIEAAGNAVLTRAMELIERVPFAPPSAVLPMQIPSEANHSWMAYAHRQHHLLVEAMTRGEGTRAQALAAEHSNVAKANFEYALAQPEAAKVIPALKLMADL
jgi:GntR family transcriptional regulator of vanillate catabolism